MTTVEHSKKPSEVEADSRLYSLASQAVDEWLSYHKSEPFDLDTICRQLEIRDAKKRHAIAKKLSYEVSRHKLRKNKMSKFYVLIDNTLDIVNNWNTISPPAPLDLFFPRGTDGTQFGFDGCVDISPGSLAVVAGVTNTGKSVFLRNLLWMNMNCRKHCTLFLSETTPEDFADYASRMKWENPFDAAGHPVFDLAIRYSDYADVIRPDDINIIDWLHVGDNFYQIGSMLQEIKENLKSGIAFIAIQKNPSNDLGVGGMWGEHLTSMYLTMDFGRVTVKKAKKWHGYNPNGQSWGFDIIDQGTHFSRIRPLKKCGFCFQGKVKNQECMQCHGTGWVDC